MKRFSFLILTCVLLTLIAYSARFSLGENNVRPFTPVIEENRETDTSPEEITERLKILDRE